MDPVAESIFCRARWWLQNSQSRCCCWWARDYGSTLQKLATVDPGFQSQNVLTFDLRFSKARYDQPEKIRNLFHEVTARLESVPGVEAAAITQDLMMRDDSETMFYVSERPKPDPKDYNWAMMYITSPDYLKAMKVRQLRGRFYNEHDNLSSPGVIVVDEELAHSLFPMRKRWASIW